MRGSRKRPIESPFCPYERNSKVPLVKPLTFQVDERCNCTQMTYLGQIEGAEINETTVKDEKRVKRKRSGKKYSE